MATAVSGGTGETPRKRKQSPYGGIVGYEKDRTPVLADTEAHVFVIAPTQSGKSTGYLAPAAVSWPGPLLNISSKDDLLQMAGRGRPGQHFLLDLRGIRTPDYAGVELVRLDPTSFATNELDARELASLLVWISSVSGGGGGKQPDPFWTVQTTAALAPILMAASKAGNGGGSVGRCKQC